MWPDIPEQRLMIVKQRQAELRAEAASARRVAPDRSFSGLRLRVGSLIIVVGRTFADDMTSPHPARF
ncbi:MAG TPA: hypothetical protein VF293_01310 [Candidatus Limnocylindrales bacterium]|jgi:hypothetical protein